MRFKQLFSLFTKQTNSGREHSKISSQGTISESASLVCLKLSSWGEKTELLSAASQLLMNAGKRSEALSCALMIAPSLERFSALAEIGIADLKRQDHSQAIGVFKQAIQSLPIKRLDKERAGQLAKIAAAQARCGDLDVERGRLQLAA